MKIWKKQAPAVILGLYTTNSIGLTISPLITAPFLSHPLQHQNHTTNRTLSEKLWHHVAAAFAETDINDRTNVTMSHTHMYVPYGIFGAWSIVVGAIFLAFYCEGTRYPTSPVEHRHTNFKKLFNPATCAQGSAGFGLFFIASLLFCFYFLNGRDRGLAMFVFAIANKGLHVDKSTASLLLFSYNLSGALSRGACAVIAIWLPIQAIVLTLVCGAVAVQVLLLLYGLQSIEYLWTLACVTATFITPTFPSVMAWANVYIDVTGVVIGVLNLGVGLGGLSCMYLSGYLFQHRGSRAVLQLSLLCGSALAGVFIVLQIVAHRRGSKHQVRQRQIEVLSDDQAVREQQIGYSVNANDDSAISSSTEALLR